MAAGLVDLFAVDFEGGVEVCGSTTMSEPMTEPVFPRMLLRLAISDLTFGSDPGPRCLRDPTRVQWRIRVRPEDWIVVGVGARSPNFGRSFFGYYAGTSAQPIGDLANATRLPIPQSGPLTSVNFFAGPGKLPWDP